MGKFLKIAGWLLLGLLAGGALWAYLAWQRLIALPDWYASDAAPADTTAATPIAPASAPDPATIRREAAQLHQAIRDTLGPAAAAAPVQPTLALSSEAIEILLLDRLLTHPVGGEVLAAAQGFGVTIEAGTLKSGLVINTDRIPRQSLSPREIEALDRLLDTVPGLRGRDLYLGIAGQPQVVDGQVQWQDNLRLEIGETQWSLPELAQGLGVDPGKLDQELNKVLSDFPVESLRLEGDRLILQGAPPSP